MPDSDRYYKAVRRAGSAIQMLGSLYLIQVAIWGVGFVLSTAGRPPQATWGYLGAGPFYAIYGAGLLWLGKHLAEKDNLRESLLLLTFLLPGPIALAAVLLVLGPAILVQSGAWVLAGFHIAAVALGLWAYRLRPKPKAPQPSHQ